MSTLTGVVLMVTEDFIALSSNGLMLTIAKEYFPAEFSMRLF